MTKIALWKKAPLPAARTAKASATTKIERQLADLEALSRAAETVAKTHGLRAAYEAHQKASRVIQEGGTLEDALPALGT